MKVVTWNVRGFNKVYKHKELIKFLQVNKVDMIAILEHRVLRKCAEKIITKIAPGWGALCKYQTGKGRVWLLWNPTVCDFSEILINEQYIHGLVNIYDTNKSFYLHRCMGCIPFKIGKNCGTTYWVNQIQ